MKGSRSPEPPEWRERCSPERPAFCDFEKTLMEAARSRGLDGVICGHVHHAEARRTERGEYYNCGDWVESCTALVEYDDGKIQLIDGVALVEQLRETERALKLATQQNPVKALSASVITAG